MVFKLSITYNIPYIADVNWKNGSNDCNNGLFTFYSNDIVKINKIKDLIYFDFLIKLCCCGDAYLCVCNKGLNPCKYCLCGCQDIGIGVWLKEHCDYCKEHERWQLDLKNDYIFLIDIHNSYQSGLEVIVRFADLENGRLYDEFSKSGIKKELIPVINYNIEEILSEEQCKLDCITYKTNEEKMYDIDYDLFITIITNENFTLEEMI